MSVTFDLSPLRRFGIGFDHVIDLLDDISRTEAVKGFPPYNVEKTREDDYRITMAVAGFGRDEISITTEGNTLIVSGKRAANPDAKFLYRGFGVEAFDREFKLADHVKVIGANLQDGLLDIKLARELPQAMRPRRIEIAGETQPKLVSKAASTSSAKPRGPRLAARLFDAAKKELRNAAAVIVMVLLACSAAVAQTTVSAGDTDLVVTAGDTAEKIQAKLVKDGYTDIQNLKKDADGGWHGVAKKDGKEVAVYLTDVSRLSGFNPK